MASDSTFCQMVRASGLAEPWTHVLEDQKFGQFGWRCTTKESGYGIPTLVGNYNEERFNLDYRLKTKPLPSQYNHYFSSTYDVDYNTKMPDVPCDAKGLKRYHPRSFPGHQPELDTAAAKGVYNDWNTTSMAAYKPYNVKARACCPDQKEQQQVAEQYQHQVTMETTPIAHLGARAGHPATGGHVIAAPHGAPGTGAGAHQKSFKSTIGY